MIRLKWIVGMAVAIAMLSPGAGFAKERRIALVIGNGAYKDSPLRNPVNDANDISAVLRELDFQVITRTDATLRQMEGALDEFWSALKGGGVGLFYYAGHGLQVQGRNYLVPVDAKVAVEQDVKFECLDAGKVLGRMEAAANELNLVFLDACRNNPFARSFRSGSRGLARMDAPTGSLVAFATAPGSVAADGNGKNGVFTEAFIKNVRTPGIPINKLLMRVRRDVATITNRKQVPWESSSLMGDFYFASLDSTISGKANLPLSSLEEQRKLVEKERLELERLRAEIEQRKTLEAERIRLQKEKQELLSNKSATYASLSPSIVDSKIIAQKDHYRALASGIVIDSKMGLEWCVGPDKDTTWDKARQWVRQLTIAGGGWRMPTIQELGSLYQKGNGTLNLTPLLDITGWWVWSGTEEGSSAVWYFDFLNGKADSDGKYKSYGIRAFAVRTRQ